ncbi:hypothetical protein [Nocardioides mangrovi]|uniref:Uncharacterized protein n=1 Tax=Nocardioides mangrovi TaxID=2874580 RepID=A0ABS7UD36_9ACTN|nr:hypothetical protein [Nocardioides mangrovi]MBZ5738802.1 hypothetical protein [Nocardioides mangrovi]
MGGRSHRDELIALVALVVLAALITVTVALLEPDNPLSAAVAPAEPSSDAATPSPADPGDAVDDQVLVGDDAFVYACDLVPKDDVTQIFGEFGSQAYVRQQYLTRTPTQAEFTGASAFAYGGLATECTYWFDDPGAHSLRLTVTQLPSDRLATRRWSHVAKEADPVPGTGGLLRYDKAEGDFEVRSDRVLVEARYDVENGRKHPEGPSRQEQTPLMVDLRTVVDQHLADGTATAGPRPTNTDATGTLGGAAYVEPCVALSADVFTALGGPPAEPLVVDTSLIADDPWTGADVSSCERSGAAKVAKPVQERRTFAVLEIRYAADQASAEEVRERHLERRYPRSAEITKLHTDDGVVDVVEPPAKKSAMRTRIAHVVAGPYELRLAVVRDVGPRHPTGTPVTDAELLAAVSALRESVAVP